MANRKYEQGTRFEREVIKDYEAMGWHCIRASGSHGAFDVVAIHSDNYIHLIQCKVTKDEKLADRMLVNFYKNPPLPRGRYVQRMHVKIPRKGTHITIVLPAKNPPA